MLFGGPGVGSGGLIPLSSLNGVTGFKLDGEVIIMIGAGLFQ